MAFDGTEGGEIELPQAAALTKEHRDRNPTVRKGHFFGKDILNKILEQDGCMGIRIYYGIDPDTNKRELVIVGADSSENDMTGLIADFSAACPNKCSSSNDLNS